MEVWLPTPIKNKATRFHNRVQPQTFTPCYSGFSPFKHTTEFSIEFANIRCRMTSKNMMSRACQELKHHPLPPHPETHSGIPKINQIWREASHLFVLNMKRLKGYGKGNIKWNNNLKKLILAKTHFFSIYKTMNFFFFAIPELQLCCTISLRQKNMFTGILFILLFFLEHILRL